MCLDVKKDGEEEEEKHRLTRRRLCLVCALRVLCVCVYFCVCVCSCVFVCVFVFPCLFLCARAVEQSNIGIRVCILGEVAALVHGGTERLVSIGHHMLLDEQCTKSSFWVLQLRNASAWEVFPLHQHVSHVMCLNGVAT